MANLKRNKRKAKTQFGKMLVKLGLTYAEVARELECTRASVTQLAHGTAMPSLRVAHAIEIWSDGEVPMTSWLD